MVSTKPKSTLNFFLQFFCPSDSFWSYIGAIVYPKGRAFDKKLKVLFGFVDAENPDFCAAGGGRNHLQKQGNFLVDERNSIFIA